MEAISMKTANLSDLAVEAKVSPAANHLLMEETNAALMPVALRRVRQISNFVDGADVLNEYFATRFNRDVELFDQSKGLNWLCYARFRFACFVSDFFRRKAGHRDCHFTNRGGRKLQSFNTSHPVKEDGKTITLAEQIADSRRSTVESRESFDHITKRITPRERLVIRMYYMESRTMGEIGKAIGVSESRVSQIHARVIEQLRASLS